MFTQKMEVSEEQKYVKIFPILVLIKSYFLHENGHGI